MTEKVKGPQSYFPSIEAKYGKPIEFWMVEIAKHAASPHMQIVSVLKTEYALGHGHANALVAYYRAKNGL